MVKKADSQYREFIDAIYKNVFGRSFNVPDREVYIDGMASKIMSPGDVLKSILTSDQIEAKKLSNEAFVRLAFKAFDVRKPEQKDVDFWVAKMEIRSKVGVINGICLSDSWAEFCNSYGV